MAETVLEQQLKVEVAAQDSDLTAFYEQRINGDSDAVNPERLYDLRRYDESQLAHETKHIYNLSDLQYLEALALCLATIAGIQIGRDFFNGQP